MNIFKIICDSYSVLFIVVLYYSLVEKLELLYIVPYKIFILQLKSIEIHLNHKNLQIRQFFFTYTEASPFFFLLF